MTFSHEASGSAAGDAGPLVAEVLAALAEPAGQANPYPLYDRLRAAGPALAAPDGMLVVSGYEACSALLREHRLRKSPERMLIASGYPDWADRPALRLMFTSILMLNPPAHTRLRGLVSAVFAARRVEALRSAVQRLTEQACDQLAGDTDFISAFAFPLPVNVIGELLGIPESDRAMFQDIARDWTAVLEGLSPSVVDQADKAAVTIGGYLAELAESRRRHPAEDLLSALASTAAGGEALTSEELVTMAALLLAAGFETTTGLLSNGLLALLRHPDQARRLRTEPGLAGPATEELLRYDSPVQMLFGRSAPEDMTVAGLSLFPGQRVLTLMGAANRDPAAFTQPDRLVLDRAEQPPLSFGGGIHYCLGAPLARLEAQIAFPMLLARFPDLELAGEPVGRPGIALHGHASLPVSAR